MPRVPPAAMVPRNNRSEYPCFSISSMATVPIVAAVATLEPDVAANIAHAAILACISPPGIHGIHNTKALYILPAIPERRSISPRRTKNGIATSRKLFDVAQVISPIATVNGSFEYNSTRRTPRKPSPAETGMASASRPMRITRAVSIIMM